MAKISTGQFYFRQYGGYAGLRQVLAQDLVDIPDMSDGELTQPGTYTDVRVDEIQSHGHNKYTVFFTSGTDTFLHRENVSRPDPSHWFKSIKVGLVISKLTLSHHRGYSVGYMEETYYLLDGEGLVVAEFDTANKLHSYCVTYNVNTNNLRITSLEI